jgi:outer membrane protein
MRLKSSSALALGVVASLATGHVAAGNETGDWVVRAGASLIDPKSDNGTLDLGAPASVNVDSQTGFTFNVSYFFTPHIAVELLGAYPYQHDFTVSVGGTRIDGHVDHLPPTLSVQYHFLPNERIRPYAGIGVNYTMFDNAHLEAPVSVRFDDSTGAAFDAGIDFDVGERWLVNVDIRYIEISTDTHVAGSNVGNVEIDPMVYGVNVGYRF